MSTRERLIASHQNASWLPDSGRADVILAAAPDATPSPVCLVRVLVTCGDGLLVEPRSDGRGLDIPTIETLAGDWQGAVAELCDRTAVDQRHIGLLGYVRNDVPGQPQGYPWPLPLAHFAVWHCYLPESDKTPGMWLNPREAKEHLADRHWWPLATHATSRTAL